MRGNTLGPVTIISYIYFVVTVQRFCKIYILDRSIGKIVRTCILIYIENPSVCACITVIDPVIVRSYYMQIKIVMRTPDHRHGNISGTALQYIYLLFQNSS